MLAGSNFRALVVYHAKTQKLDLREKRDSFFAVIDTCAQFKPRECSFWQKNQKKKRGEKKDLREKNNHAKKRCFTAGFFLFFNHMVFVYSTNYFRDIDLISLKVRSLMATAFTPQGWPNWPFIRQMGGQLLLLNINRFRPRFPDFLINRKLDKFNPHAKTN